MLVPNVVDPGVLVIRTTSAFEEEPMEDEAEKFDGLDSYEPFEVDYTP